MTELVELYSKGIKRKLKNYWAAWLPATRFAVGDIGTLNGYVFQKVGTLAELGIKFYAESGTDASTLDISSESGVTIRFKAAGETNKAFYTQYLDVPLGPLAQRMIDVRLGDG